MLKKCIMNNNIDFLLVSGFIDFRNNQKVVFRGGIKMYDVKGHHVFLYEHELYEHYLKHRNERSISGAKGMA